MATQRSHRRCFGSSAPAVAANSSSSSSSSSLKRHLIPSSENAITIGNTKPISNNNNNNNNNNRNRKRPPLSNLTNQSQSRSSVSTLVPCTKSLKPKKGFPGNHLPPRKPDADADANVVAVCTSQLHTPKLCNVPTPLEMEMEMEMDLLSESMSMEDSISTCDSLKSPEIEYLDETHSQLQLQLHTLQSSSILTKTCHLDHQLQLSAGNYNCKREILSEMEVDKLVDVDDDKYMDPQFCATIACDIYNHLRASETLKRPSTDFIDKIQKDINASMRSILVDWLVEVAEEYRLVPDTLYLTVNYIDRFLSGNPINRQRLQLLGVGCMMIAAKYEEICAPQVEEFCYITDNTYLKEEVLEMEAAVLSFLKFEMTAPTTKCFLRRFIRAAQVMSEVPLMQLECLSNYVAELSLLDYNMLQYAPSLTAASAVFLAKYILDPSRTPWNSTLLHYTLYEPSDLHDCVKALHQLCLSNHSSSLPAIREKYSQHKYKFVAKKCCPPTIPSEYFQRSSSS